MLALELERKVICQMPTLMITAKQPQCVWIPDLERPEVQNALKKGQFFFTKEVVRNPDLYAEISTVDVVTQEQIARLGWVAPNFEQLHEIVILAMHITANSYGRIHFQQVGFGPQDLCALLQDP